MTACLTGVVRYVSICTKKGREIMDNAEVVDFKRKAYEKMLAWKSSLAGKTALLIEGARRVGKTHLVCRFAKNEYASSLYIDFSAKGRQTRAYKRAFEECENIANLLERLQVLSGVKLVEGESCVIFDEVQRYPMARESIKQLVEYGKYHYIETGSLLGIHENVKDIVIPSEVWPGESADPDPTPISSLATNDGGYVGAIAMLHSSDKAKDGFDELQKLSDNGNAQATYLLSRLYFKSQASQDYCPDSILQMQSNTGISIDNGKAHQLLEQTIQQDPSNYKALFELGCDYFGGASRASEYNRDLKEALRLFKEALPYAQQANDGEFISRIQTNIQKLENVLN